MQATLQQGQIVLMPDDAAEARALAEWQTVHAGHVLVVRPGADGALALDDLGDRAEACREAINVFSGSPDADVRLIGNLGTAPFELDGRRYTSVESFWQGLKFPGDDDRRAIASLSGLEAHARGAAQGYGAGVSYGSETLGVGSHAHWALMERACTAKFEQNAAARAALLATGERPLTHVVQPDSRAIPGVIMADIWMRIRADLKRQAPQGPGATSA